MAAEAHLKPPACSGSSGSSKGTLSSCLARSYGMCANRISTRLSLVALTIILLLKLYFFCLVLCFLFVRITAVSFFFFSSLRASGGGNAVTHEAMGGFPEQTRRRKNWNLKWNVIDFCSQRLSRDCLNRSIQFVAWHTCEQTLCSGAWRSIISGTRGALSSHAMLDVQLSISDSYKRGK